MRHQHARVVFTACLAAAAAAQAPGTSDGFRSSDAVTAARGGPQAEANDELPRGFGNESRLTPQGQDPDYSLRGLFLQQHGDFLSRMEPFEPMVAVRGAWLPNQRISHEPGSFELVEWGFDATLPFNVSTDGYLLFGAYYDARRYQFSTATTLTDETLTAGGLKFGFGGFLDDNFLVEVETRPGVWSDTDAGLHHKDFDFPSQALATWRVVDPFFFKFGARYNQVYEDAPWMPLLGFAWDITGTAPGTSGEAYAGSWRLDVLFPEHLEVSYWSSPSTGWMWGVDVTGAEYHARTSQATGNQQYDVRVQEVTTYLGMTHRMSDMLSFGCRAGAVIAGDYDLFDGSGQRIEGALDQGFFASVTFGLSF